MKKTLLMIFLFLAITAIPQLLYYWLSPGALCRHTVYAFASSLCLLCNAAVFTVCWNKGIRESAGLGIVAGVSELGIILVSALLLTNNATIRTSCYAMGILSLVVLTFLVPFFLSSFEDREQGVRPLPAKDISGSSSINVRKSPLPPR